MAVAGERTTPQLSVVIPTHNRARMLDVAIGSVLESSLISCPTQIIVSDDDSHDNTEEVCCRYGVTYLRVNNRNISRTRNAGFELVKTDFVTFLDDDDAWLPGNMEPQLEALLAHPEAAFAYGMSRCADANLQPLAWTFPTPPLPSGRVPSQLHSDYPNLGVVLFRREAVEFAGGFDPCIPYYQDADLMLRLAASRPIVGVDFVGILHRLRSPSRARSDYYWTHREVVSWSPRNLGVNWKSLVKMRMKMRGLLYHHFYQDAVASVVAGQASDALVSLARAMWISPERSVRYAAQMLGLLWQCLHLVRPNLGASNVG